MRRTGLSPLGLGLRCFHKRSLLVTDPVTYPGGPGWGVALLVIQLVSKSVSVPGNEESVTLWDRLDAPTQSAVKAELLKHLQEEPEASILHKVCDAVSEIGSIVIDANGWPELLPFMFACVQGTNPLHRESALRIFAQVGGLARPHTSCEVRSAR